MSFILEQVKNGKDIILFNNYKYRESYSLKCGDIVWRCLGKNCKASIKTNSGKTGIFSCNEKHNGPHPVTLRALTPSKQQIECRSLPNTPSVDIDLQSTPTPSSTPMSPLKNNVSPHGQQPSSHDHTAASSPDLHADNILLRKELGRVRAERQILLDHSIESDQRLLQFTDDVFLRPDSVVDNTEFEPNKNKLREMENELQQARETIKILEGIIASNKGPCRGCQGQAEDTKKMITSIRCLEAEIESLQRLRNTPAVGEEISNAPNGPNVITNNRFNVLSDNLDSEEDMDNDSGFITASKKKTKTDKKKKRNWTNFIKPAKGNSTKAPSTNKQLKTPFRNLTIVGDSHARHLSNLIRPLVHPETNISGMCKPGAGLLNIAPTSAPPPENCYLIIAGTNDVNNQREDIIFNHLEDMVKRCSPSSRILLMPLTPRYDLPLTSPAHRTVHLVNNFIGALCRRHDGVDLLDIRSIGRHHYTSHGLHLRTSGKKLLANLIAKQLSLMRPQSRPAQPSRSLEATLLPATTQPTQEYDTYADAVLRVPSKTHIIPQESKSINSSSFLLTRVQDLDLI